MTARLTQRSKMRGQFAGKSVAELTEGLLPKEREEDHSLEAMHCATCGTELPPRRDAGKYMVETDGGALYFDRHDCVPADVKQLKRLLKKVVRRLL